MTEQEHGAGLLGGASRLAGIALATVRTRLELLGLELAEERERLVRVLMWGAVALLLLALGLLTAVVLLALSFWEQRLWVLGCLALALLLSGAFIMVRVLRDARHRAHPFQSSVAELAKDIHLLKAAARNHPNDHPD
ncbi:MAG: phage holin family protein [Burkholderiales bacterium]